MVRCMCRYRSLAGHSLRALRLDLELAVLHYLQDLPSNKWACEEEEATEVSIHSHTPSFPSDEEQCPHTYWPSLVRNAMLTSVSVYTA